jgi:hypothetical protein
VTFGTPRETLPKEGTLESVTLGTSPLVLLIVPPDAHHQHAAILTAAGFRVVSQADDEATVQSVLDLVPGIIVAELSGSRTDPMFGLVHRLKDDLRARDIPLIVYGIGLTADQIEQTAHAGAMWLQLEPCDGYKLLAAVRGVLSVEPRSTPPFTVRRP